MTDIRIESEFGIALLYAESEAGEAWLERELGPSRGLDFSWTVEEEYVDDQVRCAEGDGLTVVFSNTGER